MARIEGYEFGRVLVDGEEPRNVIVVPNRVVRSWWRQDGHALVVDDLRGALAPDPVLTREAEGSSGAVLRGDLLPPR
jgi:hypothetical protein